jgi:hypothetical protein
LGRHLYRPLAGCGSMILAQIPHGGVGNRLMKRPWVIHPFLTASFPVLFLYAQNLGQVSWTQAWPSLRLIGGASLFLFLVFALILRNASKAGILVSLLALLFFSYTHVVNLLARTPLNLLGVDLHRIVFLLSCVVFAAATALTLRANRVTDHLTRVLNLAALVLVSISVFRISVHAFRSAASGQSYADIHLVDLRSARRIPEDELPNIYYIIVDAYGRGDLLADLYRYDNSEFLTYLREKGFYVAEQSRSNYAQTDQSVASSLNAAYLDDLAARIGVDSGDRKPMHESIQDSAVVQFLREHGYAIVACSSVYDATQLRTADEYTGQRRTMNALELAVFVSTPMPWLSFDQIAEAADLPGPQFLFAHLVVPHPPFVFDRYGNEIVPEKDFSLFDGEAFLQTATREEYVAGYKDQLIFVNGRLRAMLDELLARSSRPTIIVLQADHGPGSLLHWNDCDSACLRERFSILNAYLLPDASSSGLYPEISPVNTFRLIFNRYLGTQLELLEDRSYFSRWGRPYDFLDVTDTIRCAELPCRP